MSTIPTRTRVGNAAVTDSPAPTRIPVVIVPTTTGSNTGHLDTSAQTPVSIDLNSLVIGAKPIIGMAIQSVVDGAVSMLGTVATFTPNYLPTGGTGSFTYEYITAGVRPALNTVYINISSPAYPNYQPGTGFLTVDYNSSGVLDLQTLLGNPEPAVITISQPTHGVTVVTNNVVTYTPVTGFYGTDTFSYFYTYPKDVYAVGVDTFQGQVYVTVLNPPLPPSVGPIINAFTASPSPIILGQSSGLSWHTQNAAVAYLQPGIGQVPANGSYTVTPTVDTTYTLTVKDGAGRQVQQSLTLGVEPNLGVLEVEDSSADCGFQSSVYIPLSFSGTVTSAHITSFPARGTVIISGLAAKYSASTGYTGFDSFKFTVSGPAGTSNVGTISVFIQPGAPPSIVDPGLIHVNYGSTVSISMSLIGTSSTAILLFPPTRGLCTAPTIVGNQLHISYTPSSLYAGGPDSFTVVVNGPTGQSTPLTVSLDVIPPPPPVAVTVPLIVAEYDSVVFSFPYTGFATSLGTVAGPVFGAISPTNTSNDVFSYRYTPKPGYSGTDSILFTVVGPGGVSNAARINLTVTYVTPPARPNSLIFTDQIDQESNTAVVVPAITFNTGFVDTYTVTLECIADSAQPTASITALTNLYATGFQRTRSSVVGQFGNSVTIQNLDLLSPKIKTAMSVIDIARILTFRLTITGSASFPGYVNITTFNVASVIANVKPTSFNFFSIPNADPNASVMTNTILIQGTTPLIPVPMSVTGNANIITNSGSGNVIHSNSASAYLNDTVAIGVHTPNLYAVTTNYEVVAGEPGNKTSTSFFVTTRHPYVVDPPWNFGNLSDLEVGTAYVTPNTVIFNTLETPVNISVDQGGTIVVNGVDSALGNVTIVNGQSVAVKATSSNLFNSIITYTVALTAPGNTVRTDTFVFGTRLIRTVPIIIGAFVDASSVLLDEALTSDNITVTNFDQTLPVILSTVDSTAQLLINGSLSGTSGNVSNGDTIAIQATAANDYYTKTVYNVSIGSSAVAWNVTTQSNDDQTLFMPV